MAVHTRTGTDTKDTYNYTGSSNYFFGVIAEIQALI
jgi:hypothetical protein